MPIYAKNPELNYDPRSNFGAKGWWIIIFSAMNWYMFSSVNVVPMNVVVPARAAELGVDPGNLLSFNMLGGIIALFFLLFVGKIVRIWGVRNTNGVILVLSALAVIYWVTASTVTSYVVAIILVLCFTCGIELVGGTMTITNWFPKKKGIALGWATMGLNVSSATAIAIITGLSMAFGGIRYAMYFMAGALLVLAVINFVAFRNYPEEWNAYSDNDPNFKRRDTLKVRTGWTTGSVLKQKDTWLVGLGSGVYGMTTWGFISTIIPTMLMRGFPMPTAIAMMTVASIIGLCGSYLFGFIDQKLGTQKASIVIGIWLIIGILCFFLPGLGGAWVYVVLMAFTIGGTNNYPPSITAQIFKRDGSTVAYPVVYFIKGFIMFSVYLILGQSLSMSGGYGGGWVVIIVLVVIAIGLFYMCNPNPKKDPIELREQEA